MVGESTTKIKNHFSKHHYNKFNAIRAKKIVNYCRTYENKEFKCSLLLD